MTMKNSESVLEAGRAYAVSRCLAARHAVKGGYGSGEKERSSQSGQAGHRTCSFQQKNHRIRTDAVGCIESTLSPFEWPGCGYDIDPQSWTLLPAQQ